MSNLFLVDSHCHLDRLKFEECGGSVDAALQGARERGVGHVLCVAVDQTNIGAVKALARAHRDVSCSVGVHPLYMAKIEEEELLEHANDDAVVAVGETGLDYYYDKDNHELQQESLRKHIRVARELKKPLIIHTRDAREDTIAILKQEKADEVGGVLHCFTESWEMAQAGMELGFYVSISGIVTFRNANELREVVRKLPQDRLLIETDSPYLAPAPHRGKSNQPMFVYEVAKTVAKVRGDTLEKLAEYTTDNFKRCFPLADV